MKPLPSVVTTNETVTICFSEATVFRSVEVKCIVDMTDFSDVLGIEVLDWQGQLQGGRIIAPSANENLRWSYDEEIDALNIHLRDGYSQIQKPATCDVSIDADKRVVCLTLSVPSATR